jgi:hypothetical protein
MNNNCSLAIKALFKKKNIENSITFRCIIGIRQEEKYTCTVLTKIIFFAQNIFGKINSAGYQKQFKISINLVH